MTDYYGDTRGCQPLRCRQTMDKERSSGERMSRDERKPPSVWGGGSPTLEKETKQITPTDVCPVRWFNFF